MINDYRNLHVLVSYSELVKESFSYHFKSLIVNKIIGITMFSMAKQSQQLCD